MPSGVKKRKAARRKKEKEANINSSRDEDFKSQNERSFEIREVNASAIYDHNGHNLLGGNNEKLEKNDASSVEFTVDGDKSLGTERIQRNKETINELEFEGNDVVEVENELIPAENNGSRNISIESIESEKKFDERDDKNSSSSSDEKCCSITDKKTKAYTSSYKTNYCDDKPENFSLAAIGVHEFTSVGETINSLVENTLVTGPVKSEVSAPMKKTYLVKIAAAENTVVSDTVASRLKEDADTLLSNQGDGTKASSFTNLDSLPKENDDKVLAASMENDQVSSTMMEHGSKYLEGKMCLSSVAPAVGANKDDASTKDSETPICPKNQKQTARKFQWTDELHQRSKPFHKFETSAIVITSHEVGTLLPFAKSREPHIPNTIARNRGKVTSSDNEGGWILGEFRSSRL